MLDPSVPHWGVIAIGCDARYFLGVYNLDHPGEGATLGQKKCNGVCWRPVCHDSGGGAMCDRTPLERKFMASLVVVDGLQSKLHYLLRLVGSSAFGLPFLVPAVAVGQPQLRSPLACLAGSSGALVTWTLSLSGIGTGRTQEKTWMVPQVLRACSLVLMVLRPHPRRVSRSLKFCECTSVNTAPVALSTHQTVIVSSARHVMYETQPGRGGRFAPTCR